MRMDASSASTVLGLLERRSTNGTLPASQGDQRDGVPIVVEL